MGRNVPTGTWVVWVPLVTGGVPRRAEPVGGCSGCRGWSSPTAIYQAIILNFTTKWRVNCSAIIWLCAWAAGGFWAWPAQDLGIFFSGRYFCTCGGWMLVGIGPGGIALMVGTLGKFRCLENSVTELFSCFFGVLYASGWGRVWNGSGAFALGE